MWLVKKSPAFPTLLLVLLFASLISITPAIASSITCTQKFVTDTKSEVSFTIYTTDCWDTDVPNVVRLQVHVDKLGDDVRNIYDFGFMLSVETSLGGFGERIETYTLMKENDTQIYTFHFNFSHIYLNLNENESTKAIISIMSYWKEDVICTPYDPRYFFYQNISTITINRPADSKPSVSILSPVPNSTVYGTVKIRAATLDDDSGINYVQVKIDDNSWNNMTPSGLYYDYVWNSTNVADGSHNITVRAFDKLGNQNNKTISIIVKNIERTNYENQESSENIYSSKLSYIVAYLYDVLCFYKVLFIIFVTGIAILSIIVHFRKKSMKKITSI